MKSLFFGALMAAIVCLGSAPAFAGGHSHSKSFEFFGSKCSYGFGSISCTSKKTGSKELPDIFSVGPIKSTGPSSTAYGPCGNGFWSNPTTGICNIAISDDMNHGRDATVTDGGTAPICTVTKSTYNFFWHHGWSHSYTKDGACKVKYRRW